MFWDELLEIHKELFAHYDAEAVYEVLRTSYSSNREKYFVFLTTIVCSGGRFSGHFKVSNVEIVTRREHCLLYTSPSPRDATLSRMPSSA